MGRLGIEAADGDMLAIVHDGCPPFPRPLNADAAELRALVCWSLHGGLLHSHGVGASDASPAATTPATATHANLIAASALVLLALVRLL